jgi:hypothetical protein
MTHVTNPQWSLGRIFRGWRKPQRAKSHVERARPGRPKKRGNGADDNVQAQPAISTKKKKREPFSQITQPAESNVSVVAAVVTLDAPMTTANDARGAEVTG